MEFGGCCLSGGDRAVTPRVYHALKIKFGDPGGVRAVHVWWSSKNIKINLNTTILDGPHSMMEQFNGNLASNAFLTRKMLFLFRHHYYQTLFSCKLDGMTP